MSAYSKLLPYSCYEMGHTWHHSCSKATFEICLISFADSMRIYFVVYLLSTLVARKKLTLSAAKQLFKDYMQSVLFLTVNGFGYIGSFCVIRHIFRHINFLSASGLPGFVASVMAIFVEREVRRVNLAVYVANVATECIWNSLNYRGYIRPLPYGNPLLFAVCMAIFGYHFRASPKFSSLVGAALKIILGSEESFKMIEKRKANSIEDTTPNRMKVLKALYSKHTLCSHKHSCVASSLLTGLEWGVKGFLLQFLAKVLPALPRIVRSPYLLPAIAVHPANLEAAAFLASFPALFKATCCLGRWHSNAEHGIHGAIAGFIAGFTIYFYPSNSIAIYAMWKAIEALYEYGYECGYLPYIPYGVEMLYSISTAYLFHTAVMDCMNMKPSYWRFLQGLTAGRMGEYNRYLLDPYGFDSCKAQTMWPKYDMSRLSEDFKRKFASQIEAAGTVNIL